MHIDGDEQYAEITAEIEQCRRELSNALRENDMTTAASCNARLRSLEETASGID